MGQLSWYSSRARWIMLVGMVAATAGGCWEEIHYQGPDPSQVAKRAPRRAEPESPPATSEPIADDVVVEQPAPPPHETESSIPTTDVASNEASDPIEAADESTNSETLDSLFDEPEPESEPVTATEPPTEPEVTQPVVETNEAEPPPTQAATQLAAWQLGSKLTLAALAHDRRIEPEDARWFAEARTAAETLGAPVAELPEPSTEAEREAGSRRVHDYLFQQGQHIWRELTNRYGSDHAALFEAAVKSNVLLVLYQPGSTSIEPLSNSIRGAATKAGLPPESWQPLLDTLAKSSPAAEVRLAVRKMHADVERYLTEQAKQE